ncbi:MAG: Sec-independent protein translocase protein TatB [Dongiales bacterium]|jgi:sec-independent protein translocase protein TatB
MFDLSWSHIAILVVVALLVLGPKELPNAIRTGAQLLRTGRKLAGEFRSGMDDLLREAELEETRQAITKAMSEGVEKTLTENVDPTGELKSAVSLDPLLEASSGEAASASGDTTPKMIEHDPPPAPAHSIQPPLPEGVTASPVTPSPVTVEPIEPIGGGGGGVTETPPATESQDQKQTTGA